MVTSTHRAPDSKFPPGHTKMDVIKKGHAKDSQRYKVDYEAQSMDTQNFSSESMQETEYVRARLRSRGPSGLRSPACSPCFQKGQGPMGPLLSVTGESRDAPLQCRGNASAIGLAWGGSDPMLGLVWGHTGGRAMLVLVAGPARAGAGG